MFKHEFILDFYLLIITNILQQLILNHFRVIEQMKKKIAIKYKQKINLITSKIDIANYKNRIGSKSLLKNSI